MIETVWESPAKNPNGEPYFKVKQLGVYTFGERAGVDSIAFILIDESSPQMFGLIHERKPPLGKDEFRTTAFGGSLDKDVTPQQICIEEVKEEAGYDVNEDSVQYLGKVMVSTQMNQHCHLYLVNVTGYEEGERDLGEGEEGSEVVWLDAKEVANLEDWKASTILYKTMLT